MPTDIGVFLHLKASIDATLQGVEEKALAAKALADAYATFRAEAQLVADEEKVLDAARPFSHFCRQSTQSDSRRTWSAMSRGERPSFAAGGSGAADSEGSAPFTDIGGRHSVRVGEE